MKCACVHDFTEQVCSKKDKKIFLFFQMKISETTISCLLQIKRLFSLRDIKGLDGLIIATQKAENSKAVKKQTHKPKSRDLTRRAPTRGHGHKREILQEPVH